MDQESFIALPKLTTYLVSRCQGWTDDMTRQRGWAPEVA